MRRIEVDTTLASPGQRQRYVAKNLMTKLALTTLFVIVVSIHAAANASAEEAPSSPKEVASARGAATPEAAFSSFHAAVKKDDWEAAFKVLTDESRDFLVGSLTMATHLGMLGPDGADLAKKHVDAEQLDLLVEEMKKLPREKQPTIAPKVSAIVKKKAQFLSAVLKLFVELKRENWLNNLKQAKVVTLESVTVKGDTARIAIRMEEKDDVGIEHAGLKRVKGRWYVDYQGRLR
ncbi:hypothetical protein [Thalassoroseus pseudoceratinae]|uniref:hypothetical protein n=1 Tax=Thalassoroseus pseudoceratinae TaxID=2713176 RepID=UPI001420A170|nr:hypothetical protein [Thalassoroseus pseudoceratinae]